MTLTPDQQNRIAAVARDVRRASPMALATTYGATVDGPGGGYAVPTEMASAILMPAVGALLPHCLEVPVVRGGGIDLPLDLATPFGSEGVIAAWEDEAAQMPQRSPKLNMDSFRLKKLTTLVPCSDEMFEDSAALAAWLPLAMQTAVVHKCNDAIINGPGTARPLGILKSGSLITVAKDGSQVAGSIVDANVAMMLDRSLSPMTSTWIANPSAYAKITVLSGFDNASMTLAGRPIVLTDACPVPGQPGDLILADLGMYVVASKNPKLGDSVHLWFDQDITAFKLVYRMDGMPALSAPVTPPHASATKSHFVTTAVRA